ncbi:hypothetical protein J8655_04180 [Dickeya oryzae]|uniref:ABC transporter substrate-binding protein n=1 Tax=Dickeya oryzae TaxID=1240404 RepID=UPI001AEC9E45|nr:ABC transporter substrate-binding protein [Dickeya oryzae]MBP2844689.1 hypothetical protein [Dickeya oryzae]
MNEINIAVDVFPYKKDIWSICDYSGEQIYSKLALPLFFVEKDKVVMLAAEYFHQTAREITINIKKNLCWSNGDKLIAEDYVRSIKCICNDVGNRYNNILSSLVKSDSAIEVNSDYSFTLKTSWYDPFITQYLSLINFSPKHRCSDALYAGAYSLIDKDENTFRLVRNEFFTLDKYNNHVDKINYLLVKSDPDGRAFFTGKVHVSCNTAIDLKRYRYFMAHENFVSCNESLVMLLSPGKKFDEIPSDVKAILATSINRTVISERYDDMLNPIMSWMSMYFNGDYHYIHQDSNPRQTPFLLDISYEDFYPNKEILDCIEEQLLKYNIHIRKNRDEYGKWISESHFRFEIRKAPKFNPIQLIRSDLSKIAKGTPDYNRIKKIYSLLFKMDLLEQQQKIFQVIDFYLRQQCFYIPLFIFPTGFFCDGSVVASSLYTPGLRIFINRD